jgi:hypothetical protein
VAAAAADTARSTAMAGPDDLYPFAKRRSNSTSKPHSHDADDVSFSRSVQFSLRAKDFGDDAEKRLMSRSSDHSICSQLRLVWA